MALRNKFDDFDPEERQGDSKYLGKEGRALLKLNNAPSFRCQHCGVEVPLLVFGSENRNHCPFCLWSRHVDYAIGDRASTCLASMKPIGLTLKKGGGELMLVHQCCSCNKLSKNRLAGDDQSNSVLNLFDDYVGDIKQIENHIHIELCSIRSVIETLLDGQ